MNNPSGTHANYLEEGLLFYIPVGLMVILSLVSFKYQFSSDDFL